MNFDEMKQAVDDAERTIRHVDSQSIKMALMLKGRLRLVSEDWRGVDTLKDLKRELSQFNAVTGQWKN